MRKSKSKGNLNIKKKYIIQIGHMYFFILTKSKRKSNEFGVLLFDISWTPEVELSVFF